MKKAIILMLALSAICLMTACGNDSSSSKNEKTTSASAEVVSESESSSEDSSSTESIVVTKKEEPESSKSDSSDESKDDKGDDEDELPDNFLDIIPLADPKNQVSGNGTIVDGKIADTAEEGVKVFEQSGIYDNIITIDDATTYDGLKDEYSGKSLVVLTFDVTDDVSENDTDYYVSTVVNDIEYTILLGSKEDYSDDFIQRMHFMKGDTGKTVIGKAEFDSKNKVTILPYAVATEELFLNGTYESVPMEVYAPTFYNNYSFNSNGDLSYHYLTRFYSGELEYSITPSF